MKKIIFVCLIVLAVANFSFAQSKADEKTKTEIRRVMNEQVVAWNSGSVDGFMKGYWNSPELVFVSGTNVTKGWQPTLERYKRSYDSKAKMGALTFSDLEITVLSKDAAVVLGSWALQREKDNPHGKFTLTFRKFKDGWRIIIDHTS